MTQPNRAGQTAQSVGKTSLVLREKLTQEQVDLLKKTVAKGASDDEFALFLHNCERTGLDPFAKQIYCLQRRTRDDQGNWINAMVPQTGIDGFRLVAERTGKYRGQTAPVFYDVAGNAREVWLDPKKPPVACKVGVLKAGFDEPLYVVALYEEYVQRKRDNTPNAMWLTKPTVMLAKCAEAMALRKAFPQELSGLYTDDEIPQELTEEEQQRAPLPAAHTRPRLAGEAEQGARVNESGEVVLTFGEFNGKPLSAIPTSYLIHNFRDPWKDEKRKELASQRLGAGFLSAVYSELGSRMVPADLTVAIAKLMERTEKGEILEGEEAEELRQFAMDHGVPVQKVSDA